MGYPDRPIAGTK